MLKVILSHLLLVMSSVAMARVWREGQQRPVYVYRMITADRIEDAIYQVFFLPTFTHSFQRQRVKEGLHSVISLDEPKRLPMKEAEEEEEEDVAVEDLPDSDPEGVFTAEVDDFEEVSPWLADIWSLVWPSPSHVMTAPLVSVSTCGYQDDLLDTITSGSCHQVRRNLSFFLTSAFTELARNPRDLSVDYPSQIVQPLLIVYFLTLRLGEKSNQGE